MTESIKQGGGGWEYIRVYICKPTTMVSIEMKDLLYLLGSDLNVSQ